MKRKLYELIATHLQAMQTCEQTNNSEWFYKHRDMIKDLVSDHMPSGSGLDNGPGFNLTASMPDKLVFHTSFHHMDDNGSYDGWTDHTVTVRPSLAFGIELTISGRDRNDIKEYLHQVFHCALTQEFNANHESGYYDLAA